MPARRPQQHGGGLRSEGTHLTVEDLVREGTGAFLLDVQAAAHHHDPVGKDGLTAVHPETGTPKVTPGEQQARHVTGR